MKTTPQQIKFQITILFNFINTFDLEQWKEIIAELKNDVSRYEAIGIMDGNPKYFDNLDKKKGLLKRAEAILNLKQVITDTNKFYEKN